MATHLHVERGAHQQEQRGHPRSQARHGPVVALLGRLVAWIEDLSCVCRRTWRVWDLGGGGFDLTPMGLQMDGWIDRDMFGNAGRHRQAPTGAKTRILLLAWPGRAGAGRAVRQASARACNGPKRTVKTRTTDHLEIARRSRLNRKAEQKEKSRRRKACACARAPLRSSSGKGGG